MTGQLIGKKIGKGTIFLYLMCMYINTNKNVLFYTKFTLQFRIKDWLPGTMFFAMNIIGGILVFFVPEPVGKGLSISAAEIESYPLGLTKEEKTDLKEQRKS